MKRAMLIMCLFILSCAQGEQCLVETKSTDSEISSLFAPWNPWDLPLHIQIDDTMWNCESSALDNAISFWGSDFFVHDMSTQPWDEKPEFGHISIRQISQEQLPGVGGQTRRHRSQIHGEQHKMYSASVTITSCDWRIIAHELGHTLGLADSHIEGDIMHETFMPEIQNPNIDPEEIKLVQFVCK